MERDGTPPVQPVDEAVLDIACGACACFIRPMGPIGPIGHGVAARAAPGGRIATFFRREP
jgi:hypothetical protein